MTRRKMTDGERIVKVLRNDNWMRLWLPDGARYIDRLILKRMGEALAENERLTRERDEARAEVERLREENRVLRASLKIDFEGALKRAEGDR